MATLKFAASSKANGESSNGQVTSTRMTEVLPGNIIVRSGRLSPVVPGSSCSLILVQRDSGMALTSRSSMALCLARTMSRHGWQWRGRVEGEEGWRERKGGGRGRVEAGGGRGRVGAGGGRGRVGAGGGRGMVGAVDGEEGWGQVEGEEGGSRWMERMGGGRWRERKGKGSGWRVHSLLSNLQSGKDLIIYHHFILIIVTNNSVSTIARAVNVARKKL